jgi:hypothetical protein
MICSDSDEEFIEAEVAKHEFSHGEDQLIVMYVGLILGVCGGWQGGGSPLRAMSEVTKKDPADMLTKSVPREKLEFCSASLGLAT